MIQKTKHVVSLLTMAVFAIVFAVSCQPDPAVYERSPDSVGTIEVQLKSLGNYTHYLRALERTPYYEPLSKGGSWTVFAPTDEAFEKFLADEGYSSVDDIPSSRLYRFIQHTILTEAWSSSTLSYSFIRFYQGNAMRKRTQYRDTIEEVYPEDFPLTEIPDERQSYFLDWSQESQNTLTYFIPEYIDEPKQATTKEDVEWIFDKPVTLHEDGRYFQVYGVNVSQKDVLAENGIIHGLDEVIEPRETVYKNFTSEEYGGKEGRYSKFKELVDRFSFFTEVNYQIIDGLGEANIYELGFIANNENVPSLNWTPNTQMAYRTSNIDVTDHYAAGLIAPTNEALEAYIKGTSPLAQAYDSYDEMPLEVLARFLSPYFFQQYKSLCPSYAGEVYDIDTQVVDYSTDDVLEKKFCSNGLFVGVEKIYENNSFSTILGPLLFDDEYSIMLKAVEGLEIEETLASVSSNFTIFGLSNENLKNFEIADPQDATKKIRVKDWNEDLSVIQITVTGAIDPTENRDYPISLTAPTSDDLSYVQETLELIVLNQIVDSSIDLNSDNYFKTGSNDYIYANAGSVAGGGNIVSNTVVSVTNEQITKNGIFYKMDGPIVRPLDFTYKTLLDNSDKFSMFIDALSTASLLIDIVGYEDDKLISLLNSTRNYTLFAPNNSAMQQAIDDGVIDDIYNLPTGEIGLATALANLTNFIKLHIIQTGIVTDGSTSGEYSSLYFEKLVDLQPLYIDLDIQTVNNGGDDKYVVIKNVERGNTFEIKTESANIFSKGVVIHEIGDYLKDERIAVTVIVE